MIGPYRSEIVRVVCHVLSPFIMLFGLYVVAHGHYGPGGGFAGGVIIAVGVILLRLTTDEVTLYARFPVRLGLIAAVVGLLLFLAVGLAPLATGGQFLDYAEVGAALDPAELRYLGILVVEVAVGLAVFGTMLLIFDIIVGRAR